MIKEIQPELILLIEKFNNVNKKILKHNIQKYFRIYRKEYQIAHNIKITYKIFSEKIGIEKDTFRWWQQPNKPLTPNFLNSLKLCEVLDISIYQLFEE